MIKHIVLLKFKKSSRAADIDGLEHELGALPGEIPEIRSYEFGRDVVRSERSYDFALISVFDDKDSLRRYQVHPKHLEVLKTVKELCESVIVADFIF